MDIGSLLNGNQENLPPPQLPATPITQVLFFPQHFKNSCSHFVCHQGNGTLILLNDVSSIPSLED